MRGVKLNSLEVIYFLIDPLKAAWSKLLVSNLIFNFLFFPKIMISCNQHEFVMYVDNTWKIHKVKPRLGCLCRSVTLNTVSDTVSLSRWVTARLVSSDDKVHSDFKRTHTVMMTTSSHWRQVFQHVLHTKHYSKDFIRMNLSSTKQHVRERSVSTLLGRKLCHSKKSLRSNS